jgi:hypothetical protein
MVIYSTPKPQNFYEKLYCIKFLEKSINKYLQYLGPKGMIPLFVLLHLKF